MECMGFLLWQDYVSEGRDVPFIGTDCWPLFRNMLESLLDRWFDSPPEPAFWTAKFLHFDMDL